MQPPRRQPLAAGPDMMPTIAAPPMQFAPVQAPQGGQPDVSPLAMMLQQHLAQNAVTAARKKIPFEQIANNAQGW